MGLSKKRGNTNLITLRTELNRLNLDSNKELTKESPEVSESQKINALNTIAKSSGGSVKSTINEAKKRGRKKNELIDGSRLLTC